MSTRVAKMGVHGSSSPANLNIVFKSGITVIYVNYLIQKTANSHEDDDEPRSTNSSASLEYE